MSDEEFESNAPPKPGLPPWLATFADLMALLMCFFVLLLSFSEMDAMKFKRLAGSLAQAFGVQAELKVDEVPKGTSIIAQEFSPGRPDPTPIKEIYQRTQDLAEISLELLTSEEFDIKQGENNDQAMNEQAMKDKITEQLQDLIKETQQDARDLAQKLHEHISSGEIEIETRGRQIIIRIREKGSFKLGSADLAPDYYDVMDEIRAVLILKPGRIQVQGHTDNLPIRSARFRSNWDLSSMRAASVAHELMRDGKIAENRFEVTGFSDTHPLVPNDSEGNRARNRRVEIVIMQDVESALDKNEVELLKTEGEDIMRSLDLDPKYLFDLKPGEIF
jgi:chemotaxis protein MotB